MRPKEHQACGRQAGSLPSERPRFYQNGLNLDTLTAEDIIGSDLALGISGVVKTSKPFDDGCFRGSYTSEQVSVTVKKVSEKSAPLQLKEGQSLVISCNTEQLAPTGGNCH